jgi:hypothetical protein
MQRVGIDGSAVSIQVPFSALNPFLAPSLRRSQNFMENSIVLKFEHAPATTHSIVDGMQLAQRLFCRFLSNCCSRVGESTLDTPSKNEDDSTAASAFSNTRNTGQFVKYTESHVSMASMSDDRSVCTRHGSIPVVDWTMLMLPAYSIVCALPAEIEVEVEQPPLPSVIRKREIRVFDGARDLFFLPNEFYMRSVVT